MFSQDHSDGYVKNRLKWGEVRRMRPVRRLLQKFSQEFKKRLWPDGSNGDNNKRSDLRTYFGK